MRVLLVFVCLVGAAIALSNPLRGDLSPEFLETEGAEVKYPREQKVCCLQGSTAARKLCSDERKKAPNMTYWSLCVGATGYGCEGVTKEFSILGVKVPLTVVKQHDYSDQRPSPHGVTPTPTKTMVGLFASVGAIMHDRCCTKYNDGTFCNSNNTPFISTANVNLVFKDPYDNNCACLMEWRRAVYDLYNGFGEVMNFPRAPQPKLNDPGSKNRATTLPGKLTLIPLMRGSDWDKYYSQDIAETKGTNLIQFSKGTKLPCIAAADKRCKVKKGVALTEDQKKAGDASFCKSGHFASIDYDSDNHGVGTCA